MTILNRKHIRFAMASMYTRRAHLQWGTLRNSFTIRGGHEPRSCGSGTQHCELSVQTPELRLLHSPKSDDGFT